MNERPGNLVERIAERIDPARSREMMITGAAGGVRFTDMNSVMEFAKMMAIADVGVPKYLRGNPGACLAVTMQAVEWQMTPFQVANKSYSVSDRLAFESQLIHAVVLSRAPIKGRLKCEYTGEGPNRRCRVWAELADEPGEIVEYLSPEFQTITTKNSPLWKTDPDQQFFYYSSRAFARRHFPDVILGVYARDEIVDEQPIRDITPAPATNRLQEKLDAGRAAAGDAPAAGFNAESVAEQVDAKSGEVIPPHDAETGEIIDTSATVEDEKPTDPEPAEANTDTAAADVTGQLSESQLASLEDAKNAEAEVTDAEAEVELSPEEKIIDTARRKSMEGKKAFDKWFNAQKPDVLDLLSDHMGKLMKAARAADAATTAGGK